MPYIETPDDLASLLADKIGIYEDRRCYDLRTRMEADPEAEGDPDEAHVNDCNCRVHWVPRMADRMREAVQNEERHNFGSRGNDEHPELA